MLSLRNIKKVLQLEQSEEVESGGMQGQRYMDGQIMLGFVGYDEDFEFFFDYIIK